jgi:3-oxoacyl-[acyl-carrier protein] reductase
MENDVGGRSVIVTGGTKGIGYGIAEVFADAGDSVTIVGRDLDTAAEAASRLAEDGGTVAYVVADISKPEECARMADQVLAARGAIDVLCANAGMFSLKRLAAMTEADYDETFDTNMKGCMFSVQACLPALAVSGHGRVVVTSSITGPITGVPGWTHYGASKAAQLGFVRAAAMELAPQGITVNAVPARHHPQRRTAAVGDEPRQGGGVDSPEAPWRPQRHRARCLLFRQPRGQLHHRSDPGHRWRGNPHRIATAGRSTRPGTAGRLGDCSAMHPEWEPVRVHVRRL